MKTDIQDIANATKAVVGSLLSNNAYKVAKYLTPTLVVRASRRRYGNKVLQQLEHATTVEIVVTIGRPNYKQRDFIKAAVKADEPFPIKKIQLQFPPKARR